MLFPSAIIHIWQCGSGTAEAKMLTEQSRQQRWVAKWLVDVQELAG